MTTAKWTSIKEHRRSYRAPRFNEKGVFWSNPIQKHTAWRFLHLLLTSGRNLGIRLLPLLIRRDINRQIYIYLYIKKGALQIH
jgi:hypothetical protein